MADLFEDLTQLDEIYTGKGGRKEFQADVTDNLPDQEVSAWDREVAALRQLAKKQGKYTDPGKDAAKARLPGRVKAPAFGSGSEKAEAIAMSLLGDPSKIELVKPKQRQPLRKALLNISQRAEAMVQRLANSQRPNEA